MEDNKQTVTVTIFGEDYPIRGDSDSSYILEVAGYLDSKMREVAGRNADKSFGRIAILTALNITDELFQARSAGIVEVAKYEEKARTILEWLDSKLPEQTVS